MMFSNHLNLYLFERSPNVVLVRRYPRHGKLPLTQLFLERLV